MLAERPKSLFSDSRRQYGKRKRLYAVLSVFITILIVGFTVTPLVIKKLALNWLAENGATHSSIENVDFNYLTASLSVDKLQFEFSDHEPFTAKRIHVNIDWLPLISRNIFINSVELIDADVNVSVSADNTTKINGLNISAFSNNTPEPEINSQKNNAKWKFGLHRINITNTKLDYEQPDMKSVVLIESLAFNDMIQWLPGQTTTFKASLQVNNAPVTFEGNMRPFGDNKPLEISLSTNKFDLVPFENLLKSTNFRIGSGTADLDLKIKSSYSNDNQYTVNVSGKAFSNAFTATIQGNNNLEISQIRWKGDSEILLNKYSNKTSVFTTGELNIIGTNYLDRTNNSQSEVEHVSWKGTATINPNPSNNEEVMHLTGSSSISGLDIVDPKNNIVVAKFKQVDIPKMEFSANQRLEIPSITVSESSFLGNKSQDDTITPNQPTENSFLTTINQTLISGITIIFGNHYLVSSVTLDGIDGKLIRNKDGKLLYLSALQASNPSPVKGNEVKSEPSPVAKVSQDKNSNSEKSLLNNVKIGLIQTNGDNKFVFKDFSVEPSYQTILKNINMKLTAIDSSAKDKGAELTFNADVDDNAKVEIKGEIQPFAENLQADLITKIKSIELYPLSGYTQNTIGYNIKRGTLSIVSSLKIKNNEIASNNEVLLRKLNLSKADVKKAKSFSDELPMALDKSLDLLRDSKNNIKLSIPVNGNLEDPDFHIGPTINKAVFGALKSSMIVYLSYTLQPWGTLYSAATVVGKKMSKIPLSPLEFKAGKSTIESANKNYMDKIANLLTEKPGLTATLCGVSTVKDREILAQQSKVQIADKELTSLAKRRANSIRIYLIKNKNISPDRILNCKPEYKTENSVSPSVEIIL